MRKSKINTGAIPKACYFIRDATSVCLFLCAVLDLSKGRSIVEALDISISEQAKEANSVLC